MIFKNPNGQSYQMFSGILADPNNPANTLVTSRQISGNKIIFFSGALPTKAEALVATKATVEAQSNKLFETPEFDITYTYSVDTKKRFIRKSVIDALEMNYTAAGTIGYAAIILNDPNSSNSYIIFTDSIGTWGQDTMPIILDNKTGAVGTRNLFKNISIELEDKPSQI
jgi:hypothetical protein